MRIIVLALILTSCSTNRKFSNTLTAKGCNVDSIRKQSQLVFNKMDRKRKIPAGYFKTEIIENDSLIFIQRTLTNGNIRNTGGMDVEISKATCKVVKIYNFQ